MRLSEKLKAGEHHHRVKDLGVTLKVNLPILVNIDVPHKHITARDANIFKDAIPVIFGKESEFRADVTNFYSLKRPVCLKVADLNHECLNSHLLPINDELGIDYTVGP